MFLFISLIYARNIRGPIEEYPVVPQTLLTDI